MNILILIPDLLDSVGGIQIFNRAFVKSLDDIAKEKGWKVTILDCWV